MIIWSHLRGYAVILGLLAGLLSAATDSMPALAAELPPKYDPKLSLVGDCTVSPFDEVPDPSCPYQAPPAGPKGAFKEPRAIAVDGYGNEYVASYNNSAANGRIDVFDDEAKFVTAFAAVDVISLSVDGNGHVYVVKDNGDILRYPPSTYEPEAGKIEYQSAPVPVASVSFLAALAVDLSDGHLFVVEPGHIIEFGSVAESNTMIDIYEPEKLGAWSRGIAIDAQRRRVYVAYCKNGDIGCGVLALNADNPEEVLAEITGSNTPEGEFAAGQGRLAVAADEKTGHFFIYDIVISGSKKIYEFGEGYEYLSRLDSADFDNEFIGNSSLQIAVSSGKKTAGPACVYPEEAEPGEACNSQYLFVPTLSGGRALAFEPPGAVAPEIETISAVNIGQTEAELQAKIRPGGIDASYFIEYITQQKFESEGGFNNAQLAGQGIISGLQQASSASAIASNLDPGVAYRFRVRVENEVAEAEAQASFATYDDAPIIGGCSNQILRAGEAAELPDCRAYELVTPPDTNGRPPGGMGFTGDLFSTLQASPLGNSVSFIIEGGSLPGSNGSGSFRGDPYLATRGPTGWSSSLAGPSGDFSTVTTPGSVSPDQGYSFWLARGEGPAMVDGLNSRYVRYPDGRSELIGRGSLGFDQTARGVQITDSGSHILFQTGASGEDFANQLEPNAPPTGTDAVYDRTSDEVTHVISLLPGDITPAAGQDATYVGSSQDGRGVAFRIGSTLYLRVDNEKSYEIGTSIVFAGISQGGSRIFYVEGGDLFAYDAGKPEAEAVIPFSSTGDVTPVNVAPGGQRAYFVSPTVLGGANPNGEFAQAGEQNLYLSSESQVDFVGTLTDRDVEGDEFEAGVTIDGLGLWIDALPFQPSIAPSRLTPDGSVLLFESEAALDGYEHKGFAQVYRYDSVADRLQCLSCIPTQTPATGGASLETYSLAQGSPPPFSPSGFVPNLRADGQRAFFESTEALVSTDTDGLQDIYEWEQQGAGSCTRAGGCVYLISSGHSQRDNFLFGHSGSGDDVFFVTSDILTGFDGGGTPSIYDARVDGGFPEPSLVSCAGEGCRQDLTPPPSLPAPESGLRSKSGDVSSATKPRRCPKGRRKVKRDGKVRCVKKHQPTKHREAKPKETGAAR